MRTSNRYIILDTPNLNTGPFYLAVHRLRLNSISTSVPQLQFFHLNLDFSFLSTSSYFSSYFHFSFFIFSLHHYRRNTGAQRISVFIYQNTGVVIETNGASVRSTERRFCSDHHSTTYISSFDSVVGGLTGYFTLKRTSFFHYNSDFVPHLCKVVRSMSQDLNTLSDLCSRVVYHLKKCFQVDHGWWCIMSSKV